MVKGGLTTQQDEKGSIGLLSFFGLVLLAQLCTPVIVLLLDARLGSPTVYSGLT